MPDIGCRRHKRRLEMLALLLITALCLFVASDELEGDFDWAGAYRDLPTA